jgi:hypothetical protein
VNKLRFLTAQLQLKDPSLFKQNVCYVNGEWVKARSGKTFEVHGIISPAPSTLITLPIRIVTLTPHP